MILDVMAVGLRIGHAALVVTAVAVCLFTPTWPE
jgi:hypothetical protein